MNEKVSVIIPCYNAEKFVEKAVQSIIRQTYKNLEIICIDDCSTDNTFEILSHLAKDDERIMLVRNETNLKLIKTLNKGLDLASGKYIARMDADDFSLPERIEKQIAFLENNTIKVCGTFAVFYRKEKLEKRFYLSSFSNSMRLTALFDSPMIHPSVLAEAKTMKKFRYDGSEQSYLIEDYELWNRMLAENVPIGNVREYLVVYRISETGETQSKKQIQAKNHLVLANKIITQTLDYHINQQSLQIISGLIGGKINWADVLNAFLDLNKIYKIFARKYNFDKYSLQETKDWLHFKCLYILQLGIQKGNTKTKFLSGLWFLLKAPYLVKLLIKKTLLPFNQKETYKLL
ncbi:glycosyl transferase [Bacteroidia bacterium]|nr:glycosyl transferase [Bacteroidia bacterium]